MRPSAVRPALSLPVRLRADVRPTGKDTCIAMIDSDFVAHPDLTQPLNRIAAYYDAVEDVLHKQPTATVATARNWHGTMTACTAAGNGYLSHGEFTSLAPDAKVVLIRTMNDKGRVTTEVLTRALQFVKKNANKHGIDVVNISVYADETDHTNEHPVNQAVEDLVRSGVIVISAVGNNPNVAIRPPAAAPNGLAVGGLDDKNTLDVDDNEMYHSTFGPTSLGIQKPELIAPAVWLPAPILLDTPQFQEAAALCAMDAMTDDMLLKAAPSLMPSTSIPMSLWTSREIEKLRTAISKRIDAELIVSKYYKMVDGTSFASPIVASIVAQMRELEPGVSPDEVKKVLMATAQRLEGVPTATQGAGVVQQAEALLRMRLIRRNSSQN